MLNTIRYIYQRNNALQEKLPVIPFMNEAEKQAFINEIKIFLDITQQVEQDTKSQNTKLRLQSIIELWGELLVKITILPIREPPLISQFARTLSSSQNYQEELAFSTPSSHKPKQSLPLFSSSKIAPNSRVPILFDPELRALHDKLSGIVDA